MSAMSTEFPRPPPEDEPNGPLWFNVYDPLVDPLVLFGSCLSGLMTFFVLLSFAIYRQEQRTFRHALVFNLAVAEFINSLNGAASGIYFVITKELTPGALCSINGWLGQVSVQASDFSMFAIAVITFLTITEKVYMPSISRTKKILICLSIWIIPLATGSIAVAMGVMMPSGANWCWISASRTDLRYALTHGWRFAVIAAIIFIYVYVYWHTSRRFKALENLESTGLHSVPAHSRNLSVRKSPYAMSEHIPQTPRPQPTAQELRSIHGKSWLRLSNTPDQYPLPAPKPAVAKDFLLDRTPTATPDPEWNDPYLERAGTADTVATKAERRKSSHARRVEREVKKMLLMNAYPILFVLLWIPGLVNRLIQAAGATPSNRVLDALQAAPVFIGFANAVTYGFNQHLRRSIANDFYYWTARKGWSRMKA